jgi:phage head maturation protease
MKLTFSGIVQAVDSGDRRIISGKIAPYGEVGNTSAGKVVFAPNSITAANPDKIKLLMSHDNSKPVGRMKSMNNANDGLYASFKISSSVPGDDGDFASPRTVNGRPIRWCGSYRIRAER